MKGWIFAHHFDPVAMFMHVPVFTAETLKGRNFYSPCVQGEGWNHLVTLLRWVSSHFTCLRRSKTSKWAKRYDTGSTGPSHKDLATGPTGEAREARQDTPEQVTWPCAPLSSWTPPEWLSMSCARQSCEPGGCLCLGSPPQARKAASKQPKY